MTEVRSLGKYEILEKLGQGGFSTVYRAVDTTLDREVALKVLDPLLTRDAGWVARFRREAKTIATLKHPHIVTIYEVGEHEGRLYIAMELATGGSLADAITQRGQIPWAETLMLLKPVCEALDYAHAQGVIHRDLKPANILLDPQEGALLTDFGLVHLLGGNDQSLGISGGILGTPAYIAPEVWERNQATSAADVYALGCIVYEALTGEVLFGGQNPMQSVRAHDLGPKYRAVWPEEVPAGVTVLLDAALMRDPHARYANAALLWQALADLEAQAAKTQEAARLALVADEWKAERHSSMETSECSVARMDAGHWPSPQPEDNEAQLARATIEEELTLLREQVPQPATDHGNRQEDSGAALSSLDRAPEDALRDTWFARSVESVFSGWQSVTRLITSGLTTAAGLVGLRRLWARAQKGVVSQPVFPVQQSRVLAGWLMLHVVLGFGFSFWGLWRPVEWQIVHAPLLGLVFLMIQSLIFVRRLHVGRHRLLVSVVPLTWAGLSWLAGSYPWWYEVWSDRGGAVVEGLLLSSVLTFWFARRLSWRQARLYTLASTVGWLASRWTMRGLGHLIFGRSLAGGVGGLVYGLSTGVVLEWLLRVIQDDRRQVQER